MPTIHAILAALALLVATPCYASDWSLDAKGGLDLPIRTTPDGTYYQEAFPHNTRTMTPAWGVGLSYQASPRWSFQAHWLDLGSSQIKGLAVSDTDYNQYQHRCTANCTTPYYFKAVDSLRGVDLTATYAWPGHAVTPFLKGGLAIFEHHATFNSGNGNPDHFKGILPELEVGAGVKYQWIYLELDYFQNVNKGAQHLPISTQQVVGWIGVTVPTPF